jgi:hypothetical protein
MKNQFNKDQEDETRRRPRIRFAAHRRALERLDEAVMQAEEVKSERMQELEDMDQGWRLERLREMLWGTDVARRAK